MPLFKNVKSLVVKNLKYYSNKLDIFILSQVTVTKVKLKVYKVVNFEHIRKVALTQNIRSKY